MTDNTEPVRAGDVVQPHGIAEKWGVAWADHQSGYLAWLGWPPGQIRIEEVDVVERCTDEEHETLVRNLGRRTHGDEYRNAVRRIYPKFFLDDAPAPAVSLDETEIRAEIRAYAPAEPPERDEADIRADERRRTERDIAAELQRRHCADELRCGFMRGPFDAGVIRCLDYTRKWIASGVYPRADPPDLDEKEPTP